MSLVTIIQIAVHQVIMAAPSANPAMFIKITPPTPVTILAHHRLPVQTTWPLKSKLFVPHLRFAATGLVFLLQSPLPAPPHGRVLVLVRAQMAHKPESAQTRIIVAQQPASRH